VQEKDLKSARKTREGTTSGKNNCSSGNKVLYIKKNRSSRERRGREEGEKRAASG